MSIENEKLSFDKDFDKINEKLLERQTRRQELIFRRIRLEIRSLRGEDDKIDRPYSVIVFEKWSSPNRNSIPYRLQIIDGVNIRGKVLRSKSDNGAFFYAITNKRIEQIMREQLNDYGLLSEFDELKKALS